MQIHTSLKAALTAGLAITLSQPTLAQGAAFSTPGMSSGQSTRFDNDFNPAIGLSLDVLGAYFDGESSAEDGTELNLRSGELSAAAWVDPTAWAYAVVVFDGEEATLEEGAVHYTGLGGNTTLRIGRFFVDFGKQMQNHVHDLRTVDRPAVLRTFLGDELGGDGVEFDNWFAAGDDTVVRYSIAAFQNLIAHDHDDEGHGDDEHGEAEGPLRPGLDELSLTARLTGFTSLTDEATLQLGTSVRLLPEFSYLDETNGLEATGQDNTVWGLDATWGWTDETQTKSWTIGGEWLMASGSLNSSVVDPDTTPATGDESLSVFDDDAMGFYAFVDHAWSPFDSVGVQFGQVEALEGDLPVLTETDVYWTHKLSEFQRLRLALTHTDFEDEETLRLGVQYTIYLGPHAHGVNF